MSAYGIGKRENESERVRREDTKLENSNGHLRMWQQGVKSWKSSFANTQINFIVNDQKMKI